MLSFVLEELKRKQEYQPKGKELEALMGLRADYSIAAQEYFKEKRQLQRKGIEEYQQKCEDAGAGLWTPTRKDPWRNNITTSIIQEKLDAVVASVADLNLQPEVRSFSIYGNELSGMANGLEGLLEICNVNNNTDDKDRYHVREHLIRGTLCKDVSFVTKLKKARRVSNDNFRDGSVSFKDLPDQEDGRISTSTLPLNRVILGDSTKQYIWDQPFIFKEYTLKYLDAWSLFHKWKNWPFVKPVSAVSHEWGDTAAQSEQNYDAANGLVRMRVYENIWLNQYAILLNDVLMTEPDRPMPGKFVQKEYSVTWTPLIPLLDCAFGESLVYRMRNEAVLRDFFYNAMVDRVRQELEPPIVTSFRSIVNRQMYRPGTATPVGSDFKVQPLILPSTGTNAAFQMVEFIEKNIASASVSPVVQGQSQSGGQTAFEIQQQLKSSLRVMWNVFSAVAESKRQETNLMLRLIMEHYPEMGVSRIDGAVSDAVGGIKRIFTTKGQVSGGEGEKNIAFAPLGDRSAFDVSKALERDEIASKEFGAPRKWNVMDPDVMRKAKHAVFVIVNPTQRKSKQADKAQVKEDYIEFSQNPRIDQDWNTKNRLRGSGYDPEVAMVKDQANQSQIQAQVAQSGMQPAAAKPGMKTPEDVTQLNAMQRENAVV